MVRPPDKVTEYLFPSGKGGTVETLRLMSRTAREHAGHPRIRMRLRTLFAGLAPLDERGELGAVWDHVLRSIRFMRDPVGIEHLTDPVELDREIDEGTAAEDCDSIALYGATLLLSAGYPIIWEIQARDPSEPQRFSHVAFNVHTRKLGVVHFDAVGPAYIPGFRLGETLARPGMPIEHHTVDGGVIPMLLGELLGDEAPSKAETAFSIIGGLAQVGGGIYSAVTGKRVAAALPGGPIPVGPGGQPLVTVGHTFQAPPISSGAKTALVVGGAVLGGAVLFSLLRPRRAG